RSALVTRLSGARYRVGYRFRGRSYAYNIRVTPRGDVVHNTQFNLDALEAVGLPIVDREVPFFCPLEDEQIVAEFLSGGVAPGRLLVGMNIGAGHYVRRWGLDRFAHLADRLIERYGAEVVLPWGPGERDDVQSVQSMMKHRAFIPPPATLLQLGALLKRCTFVVSNDTGPMHIAAAVGTPVLGIHGPTNPVLQGAYGSQHMVVQKEGLECLGCNLTKCPIGHPCMLELTVDTVLKHVDSLLKKNGIAVDAAQ
ncbi:MAG: glycosyltransferase family 9 protein, partial [Bacteroidetes bacterium]|nr:glycosyltransferase family 9 protein [Bacteroidota bacterium]